MPTKVRILDPPHQPDRPLTSSETVRGRSSLSPAGVGRNRLLASNTRQSSLGPRLRRRPLEEARVCGRACHSPRCSIAWRDMTATWRVQSAMLPNTPSMASRTPPAAARAWAESSFDSRARRTGPACCARPGGRARAGPARRQPHGGHQEAPTVSGALRHRNATVPTPCTTTTVTGSFSFVGYALP